MKHQAITAAKLSLWQLKLATTLVCDKSCADTEKLCEEHTKSCYKIKMNND